ncbi:MAG: hypothetical protein HUU34_14685 [Saprospiraceae bacterium]|nr:hypothetical protein [Saprospiraceae bacterium]
MNQKFLGIDFGAKLAGTTAICFVINDELHLSQSAKKQDADTWLRSIIAAQQASAIFMDAPLSLPGVYRGCGADYHYCACDRMVGAMSPMFLGGLTARAMQLRAAFPELSFHEAYPAHHVRLLFAGATCYKTDLDLFSAILAERLPFPFAKYPENWHQVDAALVWLTGWRHERAEGIAFGEAGEGMIWV